MNETIHAPTNVVALHDQSVTIEANNLRLAVAERVREEAQRQDRDIDMTPYSDSRAWADYAVQALRDAERAASVAGITNRLHLWPDHEALSRESVINRQPDPEAFRGWLKGWWNRVSEWPGSDIRNDLRFQ